MRHRAFVRDVLVATGLLLGVVVGSNYVVDPYNLNRRFPSSLPKSEVSYRLNYRLYKLIEYDLRREPIAVFGDSRCDALDAHYFRDAGLDGVYNFGFGGGSLLEVVEALDYARARGSLRRAFVCVPFDEFSEKSRFDQVTEARGLIRRPWSYYSNLTILKASALNVEAGWTGVVRSREDPGLSKAEFWSRQLDVAREDLAGWERPAALWDQLRSVVLRAGDDGVEVTFVIPPTHTDLQDLIDEAGLAQEARRLRTQLASLAPVIDFDHASDLTRDPSMFKDPYHGNDVLVRAVAAELAGGGLRLGRRIEGDRFPLDP